MTLNNANEEEPSKDKNFSLHSICLKADEGKPKFKRKVKKKERRVDA